MKKIKIFASLLCAGGVCALAPSALTQQTGQSGDNTSGRTGAASESTGNRKDMATKPAMPEKNGVTMYKNVVYIVKDGVVSVATQKTEVADGIIVDATTIRKNGQTVDLIEGQMMTFDGNLIEAPKEVIDRASQTGQGAVTDKP